MDEERILAQRLDDEGNPIPGSFRSASLKDARRQAERRRAADEARFRKAPFSLYGLSPSWHGPRFLGGVESSSRGSGPARILPDGDIPIIEHATWVIDVDGVDTPFDAYRADEERSARARLGELWLTVDAWSFDPDEVALVRVLDLDPYVDGTRRWYARPWSPMDP